MARKAAKVEFLQAMTSHHYHTVPSDLALVTLSPEREAIFQHLSRIGSDKFVDFVIDVLVQVEGHTLIERTDGPGDEKQDILTLDSHGERHLTQCKHTVNYDKNTDGDELDLLLGACLRKNCRTALYVSNADFTPQAKRYVTDREYARGSVLPKESLPTIDYWNGRRIWDRVSKSNAILNKWFSGMAQAHALRRFSFDIVLTQMPSGEPCPIHADAAAGELAKKHKVAPAQSGMSFDVTVDDGLTINLSDWFRAVGDLGLLFVPPDGLGLPNVPVRTIRVHALLSEKVGAFDVAGCRDRIVRLVIAGLPPASAETWWHVVATGPQTFVFLQDVGKAVHVTLDESRAFVRVGDATEPELTWAVSPGDGFTRVRNADDPDDEEWRHDHSGVTVRVLVEQLAHPVSAYEYHLRQEHLISELRRYTFRAVEAADDSVAETVRRLCLPEWPVLRSEAGKLFWGYPPDAPTESVKQLELTLARRDVTVFAVRDEDRDKILQQIDTTPKQISSLVSSEAAITTPVALGCRVFLLSRTHEIPKDGNPGRLLEVLKFKAGYEARHGHEMLGGRTEATFAGEELRRLLFDLLSFRGERMIDVDVRREGVLIYLRVREGSNAAARELTPLLVQEFESVSREIMRRLSTDPEGPAVSEPHVHPPKDGEG